MLAQILKKFKQILYSHLRVYCHSCKSENPLHTLHNNSGRIYKYFIIIVACISAVAMVLFACTSNPSASGVFEDVQAAFSSDASEVSGIFESEDGRLSSDELCYNNESCVKLCDSMLKDFSDQKECYSYKEVDVQALRDTYNKLVLGSDLGRVDPREMEDFLDFGISLWRDAITGFERGWESEDGRPCKAPEGDRLSQCQSDDYYLQRGYTRKGAAAALAWIARNNWLADLLLDYDDDFTIMHALVDILDNPESTFPLKYLFSGDRFNSIIDSIEAFPDIPQCKEEAENLEDLTREIAFALPCLDQGFNYFSLALEYENKDSLQLGDRYCRELGKEYSGCIDLILAVWIDGDHPYYKICDLFQDVFRIDTCGAGSPGLPGECIACTNLLKALGGTGLECQHPTSATGTKDRPCPAP